MWRIVERVTPMGSECPKANRKHESKGRKDYLRVGISKETYETFGSDEQILVGWALHSHLRECIIRILLEASREPGISKDRNCRVDYKES